MIRDRRGWTAIELLVVVGILALLFTFGNLVQSQVLPHYRLSAATRQVVSDLRLLRTKAISQDRRFKMIFVSGSNVYRVERRDPASGLWEPYALYRRGSTTGGGTPSIDLPASVITTSAVEVVFHSRGTVVVTGANPLVLSAPGPRTRNLSIGLAGLISVS